MYLIAIIYNCYYILGVRNAEKTAKYREEWRQVVVTAMGLKGL